MLPLLLEIQGPRTTGGVFAGSAAEAAEFGVLGAVLSAASYDLEAGFRVVDRVVATGLDPIDFYYPANGILFGVLVDRREHGRPVDPVSVASELEQRDAEPHVLGRLHRLAYEVTNFSSAAHWAEIVVVAARRRRAA